MGLPLLVAAAAVQAGCSNCTNLHHSVQATLAVPGLALLVPTHAPPPLLLALPFLNSSHDLSTAEQAHEGPAVAVLSQLVELICVIATRQVAFKERHACCKP